MEKYIYPPLRLIFLPKRFATVSSGVKASVEKSPTPQTIVENVAGWLVARLSVCSQATASLQAKV